MARFPPSWLVLVLLFLLSAALAFGGGGELLAGVQEGLDAASGVSLPTGGFRGKIVATLNYLISFLALVAVIAIIAAGVVLIVGAGSENSVQRGKKIMIYTLVGLLVILFSRAIVGFIQDFPV